MRVKIGPYIHRWTTSDFEHWLIAKLHKVEYHWEIANNDYTKVDHLIEKLCDYWQVVLNCTINLYLDRKKRKIKVNIDYYDTWSMDHTLALIALPMLKQLRDTKQGSPFVDDEDVPVDLRSSADPNWSQEDMERDGSTDEFFHKRWEWIMDEMIWAFEQIVNDEAGHQFHKGEIDIKWTPTDVHGNELPENLDESDIEFYRMDKGPNDTHIFDKDGYTAWNERIIRGTTLFGKYFRGLWD